MKHTTKLLAVVMLYAGTAFGDSKPSVYSSTQDSQQKPLKIGQVKIKRIFEESKLVAKIQSKAEAEINKKVSEIRSMEAPFTEKAEKLQRDGRNMTQDKREALEGELASMKIQIEIKQRGVQAFAQELTQKAEREIFEEIEKACKKLTSYDLVDLTGTLIINRPGLGADCTGELIRLMDEGAATESMTNKLASEVKNIKNK